MKLQSKGLLFIAMGLVSTSAYGEVLKLDLKTPLTGKPLSKMLQMRAHVDEGDFKKCLQHGAAAQAEAGEAAPWVFAARLECAASLTGADAYNFTGDLISIAERNREWFFIGPYSQRLRRALVEVELIRIEALILRDRKDAASRIEKTFIHTEWMDQSQRSRLFRLAGEVAFLDQKLKRAESFFLRSLSEKELEDVRRRLQAVRSLLKGKEVPVEPTAPEPSTELVEFSPKEKEVAERMAVAMKNGDLVNAVEDGIYLLQNYPGSQRAKWATDRIWEAYASIAGREDPKFDSLRGRVVGLMTQADGLRLYAWVDKAFRQNWYQDVLILARAALQKLENTTNTTKLLSWQAHAAYFTGDLGLARKTFVTLSERHGGTPEATTALFRLGIMDYRAKEYPSAVAQFERLLAFSDIQNWELSARYWLWRGLTKLNSERAKEEYKTLLKKFPLSYYGLRARAESEGGTLTLPEFKGELASEIEITPPESKAWKRAQMLLRGKWVEEARSELAMISAPTASRPRVLFSRLWAQAGGYLQAISLANTAWDAETELRSVPFIRLVYPQDYKAEISKEAEKYQLEPLLVSSLIRQESAFDTRAVSSSNAIGLMQMIPPTATEIIQELKLKNTRVPEDVFRPAQNIQMGTYYLGKMVQRFQGNVPFALAAYNAGPERIERWAKARNIPVNNLSSDPDFEIWIDELPWSEPNFYVKAILRNLLIYRALDVGRVSLSEPIWRKL